MSTENTSGEIPQPVADEAIETSNDDAFNIEKIVDELIPEFEQFHAKNDPEQAAEEAEPEQEAQEAVPEDGPAQETEEAKQETLLSAKLAEKARREREERAAKQDFEKTKAEAVEAAKREVLEELLNNPQAFLDKYEDVASKAGDLALNFYARDLGEAAPDELRQQVGISETDRKIAALEAKLEQYDRETRERETIARNQATLDQYSGFLSDVPADLPYLAIEATHDAHEALKTMAQVADHMFEQNGKYPSASEVAKAIDNELRVQHARYAAVGKTQKNVEVPQTVEKVKTQPKTLSNDNTGKSAKKLPVGEDELFNHALELFEEMTAD